LPLPNVGSWEKKTREGGKEEGRCKREKKNERNERLKIFQDGNPVGDVVESIQIAGKKRKKEGGGGGVGNVLEDK